MDDVDDVDDGVPGVFLVGYMRGGVGYHGDCCCCCWVLEVLSVVR